MRINIMANKYTKENENEYIASPMPTIRELFEEITQTIQRLHANRYPNQLPANSHDAANKFIGLIKFKPSQFEKPFRREGSVIWTWDFKTRILLLLEKYIYSDDLLRDTIDSAKLIGVDWRGDDFEELVNVMNEHEEMNRIGVKEYRKQTIKKMKNLKTGILK